MIGNVEFDQDSTRQVSYTQKKSGLTSFLLKIGIAKNDQQATMVMIVMVGICLCIMGIAIYFIFSEPSSAYPPQPDPDSLIPAKTRNR